MSYRLTDVTDLPSSPATLLMIVHPIRAVDIVGHILNPYTTNRDPIENLDPQQRREDLLEQLATGERLLFDTSGVSPGIFRHRRAEADALTSDLPPRLTQALNDHWEGKSAGGAAPATLKSDSLAPAIEPGYQPPTPVPKTTPEQGVLTLDLLYRWPDGRGVAGAPYSVEGLNSYKSGNLDSVGKARVTGLSDRVVKVRFGEPAPAGELDILRRQLQAGLDGILTRERREAERLDASTDSLPLNIKAGVHFVHGSWGCGTVPWVCLPITLPLPTLPTWVITIAHSSPPGPLPGTVPTRPGWTHSNRISTKPTSGHWWRPWDSTRVPLLGNNLRKPTRLPT